MGGVFSIKAGPSKLALYLQHHVEAQSRDAVAVFARCRVSGANDRSRAMKEP